MNIIIKNISRNKNNTNKIFNSLENISKYSTFLLNTSKISSLQSNKNKHVLIKKVSHFHTSNVNKIEMQVSVPMPWGNIKAQVFGKPTKNSTPILCLHGYLDNSNSFKPLAPLICKENEYYMISIDFPGHGLSSRLPDGIPYTPKLFLSAVRRVVKHFDLKDFIFLTHSYGVGISLVYDTVFRNEAKAIIGIDWIFSFSSRKWADISTYWKEGIDEFIKAEQEIEKAKNETPKHDLTKEIAVQILLKANHHLDEASANILMERGLNTNTDGKLEFSRDIRVKKTMSLRDHYIDFKIIVPEIISSLSAPVLFIQADPASYGEQAEKDTLELIKSISENSKSKIEIGRVKGTHHFHMIRPQDTAILIHKFLDKIKISPSTKL